MIRVAIAEQHEATREALRKALGGVAELEIVGEADTVEGAASLIKREEPDVLVLDLALLARAAPDLLAKIRELDEQHDKETDPASVLTPREAQVMELLARGLTNREVAEHLDIGLKTVDTHRGHVLKKLRLRNNSELTRFAVKHGYVGL